MSRSTKGWIKGMRVVQLVLRVFELIGAIGLLTLMILTDNVEDLTAWVLRITVSCEPILCLPCWAKIAYSPSSSPSICFTAPMPSIISPEPQADARRALRQPIIPSRVSPTCLSSRFMPLESFRSVTAAEPGARFWQIRI